MDLDAIETKYRNAITGLPPTEGTANLRDYLVRRTLESRLERIVRIRKLSVGTRRATCISGRCRRLLRRRLRRLPGAQLSVWIACSELRAAICCHGSVTTIATVRPCSWLWTSRGLQLATRKQRVGWGSAALAPDSRCCRR